MYKSEVKCLVCHNITSVNTCLF